MIMKSIIIGDFPAIEALDSVGLSAPSAKTLDYKQQKQKKKGPDKRIQKDRENLKPFCEPLAVRVNTHTGIHDWKSEYKCQVLKHSFYRSGIAAWIEKELLYH
jgi:hypothetical protein